MNQMQSGGMPVGLVIFYLAVMVFSVWASWRVFSKAGQPGWAVLVPIYNVIVFLKIVNRPLWWIALMFVPIANVIVSIILCLDLAKAFGKGAGFGVGLMLLGPIFVAMLAFGSATYRKPQPVLPLSPQQA